MNEVPLASSPAAERGEIITFYSYKGGTGRTMALANVAALLAQRPNAERRVLVVDWDLEAPGLHRFFPSRLTPPTGSADLGLDTSPGLIDYFARLDATLPTDVPVREEEAEDRVDYALDAIDIQEFITTTAIAGVSIMRAGRDDDGNYAKRVNTFSWENLFRRGPTVYRAFAERLGRLFPYVLIDSRTGVTDISGICTSFLPQKLVVVFTPNRQSLTGIRKLVERATSYRRESDDLRPLLVYPLPSRIEASLERMRDLWRNGDRDLDIVGYQPMFQALLAETYGLATCDLTPYFSAVQIQQTPDYAYGEEIAVLKTSDRFSLGNSYRVFVDWLLAPTPPWESIVPKEPTVAATSPIGDVEGTAMPTGSRASEPNSSDSISPARSALDVSSAPKRSSNADTIRTRVFLSAARADFDRVSPIIGALEAAGFEVWHDSGTTSGMSLEQAIASALDEADVVVVCWSRAAILSEGVLAEATEGLRRGILLPLLLDEAAPPLHFRSIRAVDLRRDYDQGVKALVDAVNAIARQTPGTIAAAALDTPSRTAAGRPARARVAAAIAAVVLGTLVGVVLWAARPLRNAVPMSDAIRVPNFVGAQAIDVAKAAELVGLQLTFRDTAGGTHGASILQGAVVGQNPAPDDLVAKGSVVELLVANTVTVPTIVGLRSDEAARQLGSAMLQAIATFQAVPDAKPGLIISQDPPAGTKVAAGSEVRFIVARGPDRVR